MDELWGGFGCNGLAGELIIASVSLLCRTTEAKMAPPCGSDVYGGAGLYLQVMHRPHIRCRRPCKPAQTWESSSKISEPYKSIWSS